MRTSTQYAGRERLGRVAVAHVQDAWRLKAMAPGVLHWFSTPGLAGSPLSSRGTEMDDSLAAAPHPPEETSCFGVIRSNSRRKWWGWPVQIDFATVSGSGKIRCKTIIVRPSRDWLRYRHPPIEAEPADEEFFRRSVSARTAAIALNQAFGQISVYCPDVRCNVGCLYDEALIGRTWKFADFFIPFHGHDITVGDHARVRMIDAVPDTLRGQDRVLAHAQAYLDLCRAHSLISKTLQAK